MVIEPGGLEKLFQLLKIEYLGSVSAYYPCRVCGYGSLPHDPRTMRIFPGLHGDFIFRCRRCGGNYDTLELTRYALKISFEAAALRLLREGIVKGAYSKEELWRAKQLEHIRRALEIGARRFAYEVAGGKTTPWFGEWAILTQMEMAQHLPYKYTEGGTENSRYWVRLRRNIFRRPAELVICRESFLPVGTVALEAKQPVAFSMAPWSIHTELDEVILCSSWPTARRIARSVAKWPDEQRLAVLFAERTDVHALAYRAPFTSMLHVIQDDESPARGLAFWDATGGAVQTRRIDGSADDEVEENERLKRADLFSKRNQDALSFTVARITSGSDTNLAHQLNTTLSLSYISDPTKRKLISMCAEKLESTVAELLDWADVGSNPYAVRLNGKRFVCRNGVYLMLGRKGQWHTISNFSMRITRTTVDGQGDAIHELLLSVEGNSTTFSVTAALLDNHARLWREARRAAALAEMPELMMPNGQHRNLLPSLVKLSRGL